MPATVTILSLNGSRSDAPARMSNFWYGARIKTHTLAVADSEGKIPFRGSRYREIAIDEAVRIARSGEGTIYLLEKDLFETRDVKVGTYCRDVTALGVDSVEYRTLLMSQAVEVLALSNADAILAPEYFFSKESAELRKPRWRAAVHYNQNELYKVIQMAQACTKRWPRILMVLGTVLWVDSHGRFRNTCIVAAGGRVTRYDKKNLTAAELRYAEDYRLVPAPGAGFQEAKLGDYRVVIQICADCLSERPPGDTSLYLLPACDLGGAMLSPMLIILCDGRGRVSKFQVGQTTESFDARVEDQRIWNLTLRRQRTR